MSHQQFTTVTRGLRRGSPPMRLYEKAKRLGSWNPSDIDFTQDIQDWQGFTDPERDVILRLTAMFQAGEEAVTLDLLPLISVIAAEGRIEEEMFLTTFLYEEAKHTDFFRRFIDDVAQHPQPLDHYHRENYKTIFYQALPQALQALREDSSPSAQVRASVTYNLIVEGVLAETGYHAFYSALERNDRMPGMRKGITYLKQDESRHIAYGVYLLSRLIATDDRLWSVLDEHMNSLLMPAIGVVSDTFAVYEVAPFGLVEEDFVNFAMSQFSKRFERLEKARGAALEDIEKVTAKIIDENDG